MNKERKAEAANFGSRTNFTGGENKAFSVSESTTEFESVTSTIERIMVPGKVIRLFRCFACNRHFTSSRMATALVVCRECLKETHGKKRLARQNQINRISNAVRKFLRARLEAR